ncbi:ABC transporter substrate-binding protein [Paracoccus aurantiacus]|uniref:ABC transporter substrate-binding protein n=1 Tax=Paracoccus aurantiacus TaxID=2599412 RepID=UPI003642C1DC
MTFQRIVQGASFTIAANALGVVAALAEPIQITDVAGREVTVEGPVKKVILGEGRLLYAVAALEAENPFARVVGWRDDLIKNDPQTYAFYRERFPEADELPTFGGIKDGTFDAEQAISLDPDVIIMNLEAQVATEEAGLDDKLAAVGIPVVYVDFRDAPMQNTDPSLDILGKLFDAEERADELAAFRSEVITTIADRLKEANPERPLVFVERAAGYSEECCMSFGNENFGMLVDMAGGRNMASDILPGTFGTVNPEQVVASNPAQVVVTGANWETTAPGGGWVGLGPDADIEEARGKLAALMERPAYVGVAAASEQNVHGVWHQFYNSPYHFIALQQMAKWFHPDLFADIDPEATFKELHERFLPVPYAPGYFVSLKSDG